MGSLIWMFVSRDLGRGKSWRPSRAVQPAGSRPWAQGRGRRREGRGLGSGWCCSAPRACAPQADGDGSPQLAAGQVWHSCRAWGSWIPRRERSCGECAALPWAPALACTRACGGWVAPASTTADLGRMLLCCRGCGLSASTHHTPVVWPRKVSRPGQMCPGAQSPSETHRPIWLQGTFLMILGGLGWGAQPHALALAVFLPLRAFGCRCRSCTSGLLGRRGQKLGCLAQYLELILFLIVFS